MSEQSPEPDSCQGLYCPKCGYALEGTPGERCPECGSCFDREKILEGSVLQPQPVPPWCERDRIGWARAYWRTWLAVLFKPGAFAARFPSAPRQSDVASFAATSRALAAVILLASSLIELADYVVFSALAGVATGMALGSYFLEKGVAGACEEICAPDALRPLAPYRGWSGLLHFTSALLPHSALLSVVVLLCAKFATAGARHWVILLVVAWLALHWLCCVFLMVATRSGKRHRLLALGAGVLAGWLWGLFNVAVAGLAVFWALLGIRYLATGEAL